MGSEEPKLQLFRLLPGDRDRDETAKAGPGSVLSFFFAVYVPPGSKSAPDLNMEFYKDGKLLGGGSPQLPAPDSHGAAKARNASA